jgi:hypothetical protein
MKIYIFSLMVLFSLCLIANLHELAFGNYDKPKMPKRSSDAISIVLALIIIISGICVLSN